MKTPITYYGGKQKLAQIIARLIPPHRVYAEPFIGGAAVFFAKESSDVEIINRSFKSEARKNRREKDLRRSPVA